MARDLFNVPIFFIVFRETIEAAIIVSVLLSFVEQLMTTGRLDLSSNGSPSNGIDSTDGTSDNGVSEKRTRTQRLIRRMRIQIWAGAIAGFIVALSIGAAFIAVFYTKLTDLWANTEQIWEGVFSIIACIIIYIMGVAFLKMDRSRIKWRYKLASAFEKSTSGTVALQGNEAGTSELDGEDKVESKGGKWALFLLPFVTVIREGLEAVVFVGGVSLNVTAASIPIAVIVGLLCGLVVGYLIYRTGSTTTLHWFLVGSTSVLFLIGAGLASKGVGYFQYYVFAKGVGGDVAEVGDGPGSYMVKGNVWHLTYGNPETGSPTTNGGWQLFNAILGWNNTATLGSVLSYVFYWLFIVVTLIYLKWQEGRFTLFGYASKARTRLDERRQNQVREKSAGQGSSSSASGSASGHGAPLESPMEKKGSPPLGETPYEERQLNVLEHHH